MKDNIKVFAHFPENADKPREAFLEVVGREFLTGRGEFSGSWEFTFQSAGDYQRFQAGWEGHGFDRSAYHVRWQRRYNHKELLRAPFLRLSIDRPPKGQGGPTHGTQYDLSRACRHCGTGARQVSALVLKPFEVEKKGDITQTLDNEVLISPSLADLLREERITGLELRPAESSKLGYSLPWVQMIALTELPPVDQETTGLVVEKQCPTCRRDGFFHTTKLPEEIAYSAREVDPAGFPDVVRTWEHFGNSVLKDPIVESHFAQPLYLVKPLVYETLRNHKIRGVSFTPIRLV